MLDKLCVCCYGSYRMFVICCRLIVGVFIVFVGVVVLCKMVVISSLDSNGRRISNRAVSSK